MTNDLNKDIVLLCRADNCWICLIFDEMCIVDYFPVYHSEVALKQSELYKALHK